MFILQITFLTLSLHSFMASSNSSSELLISREECEAMNHFTEQDLTALIDFINLFSPLMSSLNSINETAINTFRRNVNSRRNRVNNFDISSLDFHEYQMVYNSAMHDRETMAGIYHDLKNEAIEAWRNANSEMMNKIYLFARFKQTYSACQSHNAEVGLFEMDYSELEHMQRVELENIADDMRCNTEYIASSWFDVFDNLFSAFESLECQDGHVCSILYYYKTLITYFQGEIRTWFLVHQDLLNGLIAQLHSSRSKLEKDILLSLIENDQ